MKAAALIAAGAVLLAVPAAVTASAALATGTTAAAAAACGPAGPARTVSGTQLDPEQFANATTIIGTAAARRLPARAAVIAVATAMQESSLQNLPTGDRDSLGLFQQRASWGTAAVRLDPTAATTLFLDSLLKVLGWEGLPVVVASDRVQHSAYPGAVAAWVPLANALVAEHADQFAPGLSTGSAATSPATVVVPVCPGEGGDGTAGSGGPLTAARLATTTGQRGLAVGYAAAQLGKPYQWGATGPATFDCSGLTMAAWASAGVPIGRTTYTQATTGEPVTSVAALLPGDLVFIAGSDGTATNPGHVGLYAGTRDGVPVLIQAPHTGAQVEITPVSAWSGLIVAIRRPTLTTGA